jgi:hypothetical protein
MRLNNEPKHKQTKRKKPVDNKISSKKASKTSLIDGIQFFTLVDLSIFNAIVEDSNSKMNIQSTIERTIKKVKRNPEDLPSSNKDFDISLACNEKFECSNLKSSPQTFQLKLPKEGLLSSNVQMSNSSSMQDTQLNLVWQGSGVNQNLFFEFEKAENPSIDFDSIYDLNQKMVFLEEQYFFNRIPDCLLRKQKFISPQMRTILLNWILEVSAQLGFKRETYHLTVFLIDNFLQKSENLETKHFQLLGVVCLMIAAKFEVRKIIKFLLIFHSNSKIVNLTIKKLIGIIFLLNLFEMMMIY